MKFQPKIKNKKIFFQKCLAVIKTLYIFVFQLKELR
jgi:hypothetical protein